jgi:hypothetical protein
MTIDRDPEIEVWIGEEHERGENVRSGRIGEELCRN